MAGQAVKAIPMVGIDSANLTVDFQPIYADGGIPYACFLLRIINGAGVPVSISYDGVTLHDVVFENSIEIIATPINTLPNSRGAQFAKGTQIYAAGTPDTGLIFVTGYYTLPL